VIPEKVAVWRGKYGDPVPLFGPLPGLRSGDCLAYEFALPDRFVPKPGRDRLERVLVLLDLGIQMAHPGWRYAQVDGERVPGIDATLDASTTWYVDLLHVEEHDGGFALRDLYLDVMVPMDGRHARHLDLEELADAVSAGDVPVAIALDGMRRWQAFLDRHLHADRDPQHGWTDFPPSGLAELAAVAGPLGPVVTAP